LERISQLSGEMSFDPLAKQLYIDWYVKQDIDLNNDKPAINDIRFRGYCERRATHLQKLMILCSASRGDDMVITAQDFERAVAMLLSAESTMGKTFGGLGKARNSDAAESVLDFIKSMGITTRRVILQKFHRDIDATTLSDIEATMTQMGVVRIKVMPDMNDKTYTWVGD
jgi:hypothetical protein